MKRCVRLSPVAPASLLLLACVANAGAVAGPVAAQPAPGVCFVPANNAFAARLYQELAKDDRNVFFSPFSVSAALAMAAEGARGETAAQMGSVLGYQDAMRATGADAAARPWDMAMLHADLAALSQRLAETGAPVSDAARGEIEGLRLQLAAVQEKAREIERGSDGRAMRQVAQEERSILARLNPLLASADRFELRIANSVWGEKTYPFRKTYLETIDRYYGTGGVFPCDFKNAYPAERLRINTWVGERTADRIRDLLPELEPDVARLLRLVLVNAVYFKGEWAEPFAETSTEDGPFTLAGGGTVNVRLMKGYGFDQARYGAFNADGSSFVTPRMAPPDGAAACYPADDGFTVLEMPYKGGDLSLVALAPRSPDGLEGIERLLQPGAVEMWMARLESREVNVVFPRFKLEGDYDMAAVLMDLGMKLAFGDPGQGKESADFSGMFESSNPDDRLHISKVLHKAFVEVTEKGTEAAAATAVMMFAPTAAMPREEPFTPEFRADRPFVFLIRDRASGCILFLGRLTRPPAA